MQAFSIHGNFDTRYSTLVLLHRELFSNVFITCYLLLIAGILSFFSTISCMLAIDFSNLSLPSVAQPSDGQLSSPVLRAKRPMGSMSGLQ